MKETALALALSILCFMMAVIWGGPLIRIFRHFKIGKLIRVEGPESHITKMGTPTMGGLMFIVPVVLLTILFNFASFMGKEVTNKSVLLLIAVMLSFAILGVIDDWEGIRGPRKGLGMRARTKFLIQTILALIIAFLLKNVFIAPELFWPGVNMIVSLGYFYIPLAAFIIVAASNAINFTDGLDGLAGLIAATAFTAYGSIAFLQNQVEIGRFCFTVVGALFGFLWFNVHPAELFMGDTGSLSLGATLATVSLMTGRWWLLPIIIIIPVSEVVSVMLQVAYFRMTKGKRLFKMAPIHHHFELLGWSETQVVQRFWLVSLLCAMLGIALALV
ncbi:MAG: phospho-N-acetylmuramoyl-pentapeptide-transferase [Anaerolineae bacterium]|nr:phospho-N-acetylmuramoyl-pentapeptide-transferase [Anaerolineae bacterium]